MVRRQISGVLMAAIASIVVACSASGPDHTGATSPGPPATGGPATVVATAGDHATTPPGSSIAGETTTSSGGPGPGPISPAAFVDRATKICANLQTEGATIFSSGQPNQAQFDQFAASARRFRDQLLALGAPAGHDGDLAELTAALAQLADDVLVAAPAVVTGDQAAQASIQPRLDADEARADDAARRLGLPGCVRS